MPNCKDLATWNNLSGISPQNAMSNGQLPIQMQGCVAIFVQYTETIVFYVKDKIQSLQTYYANFEQYN